MILDYSKIVDAQLDGVNLNDYPDFCDAYVTSATYEDHDMTDEELDEINNNRDYVYELVIKRLF